MTVESLHFDISLLKGGTFGNGDVISIFLGGFPADLRTTVLTMRSLVVHVSVSCHRWERFPSTIQPRWMAGENLPNFVTSIFSRIFLISF